MKSGLKLNLLYTQVVLTEAKCFLAQMRALCSPTLDLQLEAP